MTSLRDALTTAYDIAESGEDLTVEALRQPVADTPETPANETEQQRARDDAG